MEKNGEEWRGMVEDLLIVAFNGGVYSSRSKRLNVE